MLMRQFSSKIQPLHSSGTEEMCKVSLIAWTISKVSELRFVAMHMSVIQRDLGIDLRQGIYIAGSPFINMPWQSDMYSVREAMSIRLHLC
jgi:hypothetical protein